MRRGDSTAKDVSNFGESIENGRTERVRFLEWRRGVALQQR
jgi:hypothetical protein